ncbi:MAG: hypothetical protein WD994_04805, partial [Pseudomonadales bacterium]
MKNNVKISFLAPVWKVGTAFVFKYISVTIYTTEDYRMKLNKMVTGFAFAAAMSTGQAMAATQGALGVDSTGTTDVSLEIADRVQISGVEDIALGAWGGSGDLAGTSQFCVYRSGGDDYQMTLTTDTGSFLVSSVSTGDDIAFTAKIDD